MASCCTPAGSDGCEYFESLGRPAVSYAAYVGLFSVTSSSLSTIDAPLVKEVKGLTVRSGTAEYPIPLVTSCGLCGTAGKQSSRHHQGLNIKMFISV